MLAWLSGWIRPSDPVVLTEEEYGMLNFDVPEEDFIIKVFIPVLFETYNSIMFNKLELQWTDYQSRNGSPYSRQRIPLFIPTERGIFGKLWGRRRGLWFISKRLLFESDLDTDLSLGRLPTTTFERIRAMASGRDPSIIWRWSHDELSLYFTDTKALIFFRWMGWRHPSEKATFGPSNRMHRDREDLSYSQWW